MPIITLTSDWGLKDHYAGAVKGTILRQMPGAVIVDISHDIPVFDLNQASFIIRNNFRNFPEGTIHIIGVSTEASIETPHVVVLFEGHYFIGCDNGIFSLVFDHQPEIIIELDIMQDSDYFTFSTRDVFIKAACHISEGKKIELLGKKLESLNQKTTFRPIVNDGVVKGKVIYIDNYGNVFTNITEQLFQEVAGTRREFGILFRNPSYEIDKISKSYKDVPEGEMLALFSSTGYLQIAMNQGKAASLLGLKTDDPVMIEFR